MVARRMVVGALFATVAVGACSKKKPEPPAPQTVQNDSAGQAELDARRRAAEEEARRRAAEAARAKAEAAREALTAMIHFDYDESTITSSAQQTLTQKIDVLRAHPEIKLRIAGNADERGSVEYNLALGMRRANAAKDYLTNYGLDAARFETVSFGEERPIAQGHDEDAWRQNRRDEFEIIAGASSLMPSGN